MKKNKKGLTFGEAMIGLFVSLVYLSWWVHYCNHHAWNTWNQIEFWNGVVLLILFLWWPVSLIMRYRGNTKYRAALLHFGAHDPSQLSPIQFEEFICEYLKQYGWDAQVTKVTGDYGVDVIARKRGKPALAIQAKHYSGNVGVAAVQEIYSGMAFYGATIGVVIASRGGFTRAAQTMAHQLNIILGDSKVLKELNRKLG